MKREVSRLVVDINPNQHKKLKAMALMSGKKLHDLVGEFIDDNYERFNKEPIIASEEETTKVLKKVVEEYAPLFERLAKYDRT